MQLVNIKSVRIFEFNFPKKKLFFFRGLFRGKIELMHSTNSHIFASLDTCDISKKVDLHENMQKVQNY